MPDGSSAAPLFTVVMATYNRGAMIAPSIESVLRQTDTDFELIVVGDGCTDATGEIVRGFASSRITWCNLPANSGGQSAPNNEGIRRARGAWICYLGHDDIWSPDHLAQLRAIISREPEASFAVSGCVYYGPPGSEVYFITGLFDDSSAAGRNFFPPSSLAHPRALVKTLGGWAAPRSVVAPVDVDFLLRAVQAGLRFASTGRITVHKFAAGHRYLSYLRPSDAEQREMLDRLQHGGDEVLADVMAARQSNRVSDMGYFDFSGLGKGELFERNRGNKGLQRPPLLPLTGRTVIEQTNEPRALDWHMLKPGRRPFRWSGPNPNPKILIPFTGEQARVSLQVAWLPPGVAPERIGVSVEGVPVEPTVAPGDGRVPWISFPVRLRADDYTVISLHTPDMVRLSDSGKTTVDRRLGVAIADMVIEPVGPALRS